MKIDLHVHSKHSKRPSVWLLQKLNCPESYLEPKAIYEYLRYKGMSHVTITDHNSINGCLEIAELENTFLSEEITTYFPEDRCKIHILAWNINEEIHQEIQHVRENIYDLAGYLNEKAVPHAVAHPLAAVNDKFQPHHFEKLLLLFSIFELNGDEERYVNDILIKMLDSLNEQKINEFSNTHNMKPLMDNAWKKYAIAGSDDHAGIDLVKSYTTITGAETIDEFFRKVTSGHAINTVQRGTPKKIARNIHSTAYQYLKRRFKLQNASGADMLLRFCDYVLEPHDPKEYGILSKISYSFDKRRSQKNNNGNIPHYSSLGEFIRNEGKKLLLNDEDLMSIVNDTNRQSTNDNGEFWFDFSNRICNRAFSHIGGEIFKSLSDGMIFDIFHNLGSAGSVYLALSPFFIAYTLSATGKKICRDTLNHSFPNLSSRLQTCPSVAFFIDSYADSKSFEKRFSKYQTALDKKGVETRMISCSRANDCDLDCKNFTPVNSFSIMENSRGIFNIPPFLQILDYCYEKNFTHLHIITPGPMGIIAVAIARFLRIPVIAEFDRSFLEYISEITNDAGMEDLTWVYLKWFYKQADFVLVHSDKGKDELLSKNISPEKIMLVEFSCHDKNSQNSSNRKNWNEIYFNSENIITRRHKSMEETSGMNFINKADKVSKLFENAVS